MGFNPGPILILPVFCFAARIDNKLIHKTMRLSVESSQTMNYQMGNKKNFFPLRLHPALTATLLKVPDKTSIMESYCAQKTSIVYSMNLLVRLWHRASKPDATGGEADCASISTEQGILRNHKLLADDMVQ